jgi:hypothetical protein
MAMPLRSFRTVRQRLTNGDPTAEPPWRTTASSLTATQQTMQAALLAG